MREILFKAKRRNWQILPKEQWWVEGSLITDVFCRLGQDIPYILCPDEADYDCFEDFSEDNGIFEVDENTICQFTGLTDKNGKRIWENDILQYSYDYPDSPWLKAKGLSNADIKYHTGQVFWSDWRGSWAVCGKGTSQMTNSDVFTYSRNPNRVEVIGNIFDNPELLEGSNT